MISIIIPVYNVERFLDKCIDSVISQSYQELEIILVDDGSTDASGQLCDKWAQSDSRIIVVHQFNQGLSMARNKGIEIATGDYITFIDSDDYILPEFCSYLLDLIIKNDADISVCQLINVDESNHKLHSHKKIDDYLIAGREACMDIFLTNNDIDTSAWRKLYRSQLFKSTGIRFPAGRYHEDVFTTYKVVSNCSRIIIGSKKLYAYRKRIGSIVNSTFSIKHLDSVYGKLERLEYIRKEFPKLQNKAIFGVIYSANDCLMKLISTTSNDDNEAVSFLKSIYREFGKDYLRSKARFRSKLFAFMAYSNLSLFVRCMRVFKPILNRLI